MYLVKQRAERASDTVTGTLNPVAVKETLKAFFPGSTAKTRNKAAKSIVDASEFKVINASNRTQNTAIEADKETLVLKKGK